MKKKEKHQFKFGDYVVVFANGRREEKDLKMISKKPICKILSLTECNAVLQNVKTKEEFLCEFTRLEFYMPLEVGRRYFFMPRLELNVDVENYTKKSAMSEFLDETANIVRYLVKMGVMEVSAIEGREFSINSSGGQVIYHLDEFHTIIPIDEPSLI